MLLHDAAAGQIARPAICHVLAAQVPVAGDGPITETEVDTDRIAEALATCPAGQAVELARGSEGRSAFLLGPLEIPLGVALWIDPGVTVFASRRAADYDAPSGNPRALITADDGAALLGFGTVDARGGAILLRSDGTARGSWYDLPAERRPTTVLARGSFHLAGITLGEPAGDAVRGSALEIEDLKIVGDPAAPGTRGVVLEGTAGNLELRDSTLAGSDMALAFPAAGAGSIDIQNTRVDAGGVTGITTDGPCLLASGPALLCVPEAFAPVVAELVESGPAEVAAILTVPDARLPRPRGEISLLEGDAVVTSLPVEGSSAVFDLGTLRPGLHRLHARFGALLFGDLAVTVDRANRSDAPATLVLTSSATTLAYGTPLTLTATLASATGLVTFLDGTSPLGQTAMSGGSASLTLNAFGLGPHTVTALYTGDTANPAEQSPALQLQVNPVTTIVSLGALPPSVPYGTVLQLTGSVLPVTAGGTVVFRDGANSLGQSTLSGGAASLAVGTLLPGSHVLLAIYSGDAYDLAGTSAAEQITVQRLGTDTSLLATPSTASFGTAVRIGVAVTPADATGTVLVQEGSSVTARIPLNSGAGSASLNTLAPGLHLLTASYPGDALHTASASSSFSVEIDRTPTSTTLTPLAASLPAGASVVLSATVSPASAGGVVNFTDSNSGPLGQSSLQAGVATLPVGSLAAGPHSITASYAGDTDDAPSSSAAVSTTVRLLPATMTLSGVGSSLPFSAPATLLVAMSPATAAGSVTLADGSSGALGTVLLNAGAGSLALPELAPGPHTLVARYSGDMAYAAASGSLNLTVTPDPTTTTLSAAQAAVPAGSPVLLNVRVATPYPNSPGGLVSVRMVSAAGAVKVPGLLGNALPGQSFATVSIDSAALGLGSYSATATYAGDATDQPSSSSAVQFSVVPTTTSLALTLSANPVATGVASTLSATVSSRFGVPTGSVGFFRDGSLIAAVSLNSGVASAALPSLPAGTYAITASYVPSGLFGPAVTPSQILVVTPPLTISLNPTTLTMKAGADSFSTLLITPLSGYAGVYAASCSSSSPYILCSVDAASGPGPTSTTVRVHATSNTAMTRSEASQPDLWAALLAPFLLLLRRRRVFRRVLLLLALCLALGSGLGCGKGNFFNLPAGNYPVSISVTTSGSTAAASLNVVIAD